MIRAENTFFCFCFQPQRLLFLFLPPLLYPLLFLKAGVIETQGKSVVCCLTCFSWESWWDTLWMPLCILQVNSAPHHVFSASFFLLLFSPSLPVCLKDQIWRFLLAPKRLTLQIGRSQTDFSKVTVGSCCCIFWLKVWWGGEVWPQAILQARYYSSPWSKG